MIKYLLIGMGVTLLFDWAMKQLDVDELQFTNWERLFIILIWPVAVIFALYGFFKNK
jgi:hypothetical protein